MLKRQWTRVGFVVFRGLLLIILAVILQSRGYLDRFESDLYDERVIHCQTHRPPPTPSLVHLDVDEDALDYIGRWPWPAARQAQIIDEIALTKPKVLAMDVLFADPEEPVFGRNDSVGVDGDKLLAASIAKLGCALMPVSISFGAETQTRAHRLLLDLLVQDPERTEAECLDLLRPQGITEADLRAHSDDSFPRVREQAVYERIWQEVLYCKDAIPDAAKIEHAMLPHSVSQLTKTLLGHVFDKQFDVVMRERAMQRFTVPLRSGSLSPVNAGDQVTPIVSIGRAAKYSGFADYLPEHVEGTVRRVPLFAKYRGRLVPQMDLATACAAMGVDLASIRFSEQTVTIPRPGAKDVVIPVAFDDSSVMGHVGLLMDVPLFGRAGDWLTMYDFPQYKHAAQHISAYDVWSICETSQKLRINYDSMDTSIVKALKIVDPDEQAKYLDLVPQGAARKPFAEKTLVETSQYIQSLGAQTDLEPSMQQTLSGVRGLDADLRQEVEQTTKLESQLSELRSALYEKLHDRVIYFGGTATSLSDFRATSLFGECPGVVVHGAIYNAIVTGKMWRRAPAYTAWLITAAIGLLTMLLVLALPPSLAFGGSLALALGYTAFNGYFLFDRENLIVEAAGPLTAILLVYLGLTLTNFMTEIAEKTRITRRFSTYVDPEVVNYVVEHPESLRFDGERREMTVGFSDLASFTTLTDELGERVIPLLAEYLSKMVPVIHSHSGHVAQFSGDGIYFYFGAPGRDEQHAEHAVTTALEMHKALELFNTTLRQRGSKPMGMRIGISTGEVIVGDAGTAQRAAYTAMGATTNLASRLESANKVFGTRTLVTARTVELLNGDYLLRPVANLRVAGKLNNAMVYEPICRLSEATERDRLLAQHSGKLFQIYCDGDFEACIAAAQEMQQMFGECKLSSLYTRLATEHRDGIAEVEHCQGQIVLTEK